jgi:hypothetical protein
MNGVGKRERGPDNGFGWTGRGTYHFMRATAKRTRGLSVTINEGGGRGWLTRGQSARVGNCGERASS